MTLLTRQFLNMRSFWTADLNITVLRGRTDPNERLTPPTPPTKYKQDTHLTAIKCPL